MAEILDMVGISYIEVYLKTVSVASVSITFQVDLVGGNQSSGISQLNSFLESFSTFSNFSVSEDGRGLVDITVAGKT